MAYRVYSGPIAADAIAPLEKDRMLYKEFSSLDQAMSWARHVNDNGRFTLLIEGDDGTHMTRSEIIAALTHSERPPLHAR